jgi:hypothetical protein
VSLAKSKHKKKMFMCTSLLTVLIRSPVAGLASGLPSSRAMQPAAPKSSRAHLFWSDYTIILCRIKL